MINIGKVLFGLVSLIMLYNILEIELPEFIIKIKNNDYIIKIFSYYYLLDITNDSISSLISILILELARNHDYILNESKKIQEKFTQRI